MNKHIKISAFLPLFLLASIAYSCEDVNSIHQKYVDLGETIYTGKADSLKPYVGDNRIELGWKLNSDPRIKVTEIFWKSLDGRDELVVVPVNRTQSGEISMRQLLEVPEGDYIFRFVTRDDKGNSSMVTELVTPVYGDVYAASLLNRGISLVSQMDSGQIELRWETVPNLTVDHVTVYKCEGTEPNPAEDEILEANVLNDTETTLLDGLVAGDRIYLVTTYLPVDGIDTFDARPSKEYVVPIYEREIDKANFAIVVAAGDNTTVNGTRPLSNIWDGSPTSILHTVQGNAANPNPLPNFFTFDMGIEAELFRFRLWPRTDNTAWAGHSPKTYEVWATDELRGDLADEDYWKTDAWKADWQQIGDFDETNRPTSDPGSWTTGWEYPVPETVNRARYIRLVIKTNWQTNDCVNIGEITLWGDNRPRS